MTKDMQYFLNHHTTSELLKAVLAAQKKYGSKLPEGAERPTIIANHYENFLGDKNQWGDFETRSQQLERDVRDLKMFLYAHAETVVGRGEEAGKTFVTRDLRDRAVDKAAEALFFHPVKMLSLINSDKKKSLARAGFSKGDYQTSRPRSERGFPTEDGKFIQGDDGYVGRR